MNQHQNYDSCWLGYRLSILWACTLFGKPSKIGLKIILPGISITIKLYSWNTRSTNLASSILSFLPFRSPSPSASLYRPRPQLLNWHKDYNNNKTPIKNKPSTILEYLLWTRYRKKRKAPAHKKIVKNDLWSSDVGWKQYGSMRRMNIMYVL